MDTKYKSHSFVKLWIATTIFILCCFTTDMSAQTRPLPIQLQQLQKQLPKSLPLLPKKHQQLPIRLVN